MAARDYTWLQASVIDFSHRKDLAKRIPDLVMLAEERLSADLEARGIDAAISLPTVAGAATVALPPGVITIRSIGVPNGLPLDYLAADAFSARYSVGERSAPRNYTMVGDLLYLGPVPDAVYELRLIARMSLPPLADAADGLNWLMARNPALYLAATMVEAMLYLEKTEGISKWSEKYQIALSTANATKATAGDLVVRTDSRNP
jgi:hypothetical protein